MSRSPSFSLLSAMRRTTRRLLTATLMVAASCLGGDGKSPTAPVAASGDPRFLMSDGSRPDGTVGFYFLPPMVSNPTFSGIFDYDIAAIDPVVAICDVTDAPAVACGSTAEGATPAIRTFTATTNPPVAVDAEKYKLDWDTGADGFVIGRVYRIHVFAGPARRELGFADVLLTATPGQVKKTTGETIVLRDGRTLPIHFRIETGVVPRVGPARSLELTGVAATLPSGSPTSVTVTARDENGNVASGYRGTIVFNSSNATATLPTQYTFTEGDAGTHTFENAVSFLLAGTSTLGAADDADETIAGEVSLTIEPLAAARLELTGLTDPSESGAVNSITVTARDVNGNVATSYVGTIAFTSNDEDAALPENYTFTAEDAGTHAFTGSVTLRTAGAATVTATDDAASAITGAQTVTVTPAAATTLVLAGIPEQSVAGIGYNLTVTAKDQFGNVATGYAGTVQFSSTDAAATVPEAYAFQTGDAGTHAFPAGVTFKTAGSWTFTATDAATPSITAGVTTQVAAGPATQLQFTVQPNDAIAGSAIAPPVVVTAYDAFANEAMSFTGTVSVTIGTNPTGGGLSGTLQAAAVAGVATFSALTIDQAGAGYTLVASSSGLTSATSEPFDIVAPAPVEVHWINAAGGSWSVGSNWSTGTPPTAEQTVFIDEPGTYTVTLNVNAAVNSLSLGATSGVQTLTTGSGRTLGFVTSANVLGTGRLTLNGATVNGGGTLAIASGGVLTFVATNTLNATVVNGGTLVAGMNQFSAVATIGGAVTSLAGAMLRVQSGGSNNTTLTVVNGITNHGTIELTKVLDQFGTSTLAVSNGTLVNATDGTITSAVGSGGGRTLNAQLENHGTVTVVQPLTINRTNTSHENTGTIMVAGGNLSFSHGLTGSLTNSGTISVAAARTLTITGGRFTLAASGTLDGPGSLSLVSVNPATFQTGFTLAALGLTNSVASFATDFTTAVTALSMSGSTFNSAGTLTNAAGRTITMSQTNVINAALVNAGTLASGVPPFFSTTTINGAFSTAAGSLVRVHAGGSNTATLTFANGFTNHGTIELTKANDAIGGVVVAVTDGTLVNALDGIITSAVGTGGGRTLRAQLDNQGTLNVQQSLTINRGNSAHANTGTIAMTGGSLTISQTNATGSFTNAGTISVGAGRTLTITGGRFTLAEQAALEGAGALSLSAVNPAVFETDLAVAALGLTNTVASFAADFTTAVTTLSMSGSTFNGPGTLTNAAGKALTLSQSNTINAGVVNAGTIASGVPPISSSTTLNGAFSTIAGSLVRVAAGGSNSATFTVANGFTNHGTIELTKANDPNGASTFAVTNGTLVNASDGTITSAVGTGGVRNLNAQLDNQGSMNVLQFLNIGRAGAAHLNSGTIAITGGNLVFTALNPAQSLANAGTIDIAPGRSLFMAAGLVSNGVGGTIAGGGTLDLESNATLNNAGNVAVALARIRSPFTSTGNFAPTTVEFAQTIHTIPVGAGYSYTHVRMFSGLTFAGSVTVAGNVFVGGSSARLNITAHTITINGDFTTQGGGFLTMQNAAGVLAIGGNAAFGGASTNTQLTAGTLRIRGNVTQAGGSNAAFAASGSHLTVLDGAAAQTVSFATPGTVTTSSHFQRLLIENSSGAGVTLASAVVANGQLRTPAGSGAARRMTSTAGQTLQVGGLDADGLVFDAVPLRVVNGEALTRFDNAVFQNMNPAATQLRLDRQTDATTFNNIAFQTVPTTGVYLHLVDTDLVAPLFTVNMQATQPANHGGKVVESVAGQLQGWPF